MAPSPFFLCICRALGAMIVGSLALLAIGQGLMWGTDLNVAQVAIPALLSVVAVWLFFGIRTRAVAPLGAALSLGYAFLAIPDGLAVEGPRLMALLVTGLAFPLTVHGGGSLCMLRRGWAQAL